MSVPEETAFTISAVAPDAAGMPPGQCAALVSWGTGRTRGHVCVHVIGARTDGDVDGLSHALALAGDQVRGNREAIVSWRMEHDFEAIVDAEHRGAVPRGDLPSWREMGDVDRALVLEYLCDLDEFYAQNPDADAPPVPGIDLVYVGEGLRGLDPETAHEHAMALEETYSLTTAFRDDEIERLDAALTAHRRRIAR